MWLNLPKVRKQGRKEGRITLACICKGLSLLRNSKLLAMHNLIHHFNNAVEFNKKY